MNVYVRCLCIRYSKSVFRQLNIVHTIHTFCSSCLGFYWSTETEYTVDVHSSSEDFAELTCPSVSQVSDYITCSPDVYGSNCCWIHDEVESLATGMQVQTAGPDVCWSPWTPNNLSGEKSLHWLNHNLLDSVREKKLAYSYDLLYIVSPSSQSFIDVTTFQNHRVILTYSWFASQILSGEEGVFENLK